MKRVLLTGMSGTGKSTVIRELAARGYRAIDAGDAGWSHCCGAPLGMRLTRPRQWRRLWRRCCESCRWRIIDPPSEKEGVLG